MIPAWPPKPRYKAAKRLREAIDTAAHADVPVDVILYVLRSRREALEHLQATQDAVIKAVADIDSLRASHTADITNRHLTNIRDDLAAVLDESARP